jgi:hypothetical protein
MNPVDPKTNPASGAVPIEAKGAPRKPYSSPRLRSLGQVNAITLASGEDIRRKPQG